jgi:acetyl-CoA synthetase/medium-chain acyl-CoA synthetase
MDMKKYYEEVKNFKLDVPEKFYFPLDVFDRLGNRFVLD